MSSGIITIELTQVKEALNTVRYEKFPGDKEGNNRATVPNMYVQQNALACAFGKFPKKIKITIEEVE